MSTDVERATTTTEESDQEPKGANPHEPGTSCKVADAAQLVKDWARRQPIERTQSSCLKNTTALRIGRGIVLTRLRCLLTVLGVPKSGAELSDLDVVGYAAIGLIALCVSIIACLFVLTVSLLPLYPWLKLLSSGGE